MTRAPFDVAPFLRQDEGQHFDRKSLLEGPDGAKRPRDRKSVRDQVATWVAAFANAEGGVLILGLEDDGTPTGHQYPGDAVRAILDVPKLRLRPPQPEGFVVEHAGVQLLVFDVPACEVPVMVEGDGFPLRIGDKTVQVPEKQIESQKLRGFVESWESRPSSLRLPDLDPAMLARARGNAGFGGRSDEEYLLARKLADRRGRDLVLRRAAEVLFAKDGPDHPNAGVRVFRVVGSERRLGAEHNVEERPRIEGNLPHVVTTVFQLVDTLIRRPSRLVGNRFREVPEYPEFSWKEAILNAVAHRDYLTEGRTTEVWFFDDRLEVTSPGGLVPDVALEDLLQQRRVHMSRNPRIVRALVDLGLMRDQGEGIPRMFAEMEGLFLPAPTIEAAPREFRVTLRNTPTLTTEDKSFISALGDEELSAIEFRALLEAHRRGHLDNARMRDMSGLDTLRASQILRKLRDRDLLTLHHAGAASYYELGPKVGHLQASHGRQLPLQGQDLETRGPDLSQEFPAPAPDPTVATPDVRQDLPTDLAAELGALKSRTRTAELRSLILRLCALAPREASELGRLLRRDPDVLVRDHLRALVQEGALRLRYPEQPNHPRQAYLAKES